MSITGANNPNGMASSWITSPNPATGLLDQPSTSAMGSVLDIATGNIYWNNGSVFSLDILTNKSIIPNTLAPDGIYNFNKSRYASFTQKAKTIPNGGVPRVMIPGDSLIGASINGVLNSGARTNSPVNIAAQLLTANGVPADTQSQWGAGTDNTLAFAYDSRIQLTGTFDVDSGFLPLIADGWFHIADATYAAQIKFTPTTATDSFDFYWPDGGYNTLTVKDQNGNLLATNTNAGTSKIMKVTAKIPGGAKVGNSYTIGMTASGSTTMRVNGFEAYNSVGAINLINLGIGGSNIGSWMYQPSIAHDAWYQAFATLTNASSTVQNSAPDLIINCYGGTNDMAANGGVAAFTGALAAGATTATLTPTWAGATDTYILCFSSGETRTVTLTNGVSAIITFAALLQAATSTVYFTSATNLTKFQTGLDDFCLKMATFGNKDVPVALTTCLPVDYTRAAWGHPMIQVLYITAVYTVAQKYGLTVLDFYNALLRKYQTSLSAGYMGTDPIHEAQPGANEMGRIIATFLYLISS